MTRSDIIHRWINASNADCLDNVAPGVFDHAIDPQRLAKYLSSAGNSMIVALHEAQVVGMCMAVVHDHPDKPAELFLDEIGTGDEWRRKGIARSLIEALCKRADDEGIEEIWLATEPDNGAAHGLYEAFKHEREDAVIHYLDW